MRQKISYLFVAGLLFGLAFNVKASTTTLTLANTTGDAVNVTISGEPSSTIRLSFLPSGAAALTTIVFGTTDSSGNFSSQISSGGYGIPAGSPVYATVNGVPSATLLWPSYTSTITLSHANSQIAVGQSLTINSSHALILSANSLPSSVGTAISGGQITVTGLAKGTSNLILCGASAGCKSIEIVVGDRAGQTQISLSENNVTLNYRQSKSVTIFGGSTNGYEIKSNTNSTAVNASISGTTDQISLWGNAAGTATINVCFKGSETNCINLYVNALAASATSLSFSPTTLSLIPGLSQNVTVSGGPDTNYYISSNTNSGVVTASIAGSSLTVTGGSTAGTAVITVCSATQNATCGNFNVTTNLNTTVPSATVIAFSQNVITVAKDGTSNVTVSGGDGSGYAISSNSNPSGVTASISGNIITLKGNVEGSSIVGVCSGTACASIYVTIGPALEVITFSQNNISLSPDQSSTIIITGGTANNVIYSISNPNAVSASLSNNGKALVLSGKTVAGSSIIKICASSSSNNCAELTARLIVPEVAGVKVSDTGSSETGNNANATAAQNQLQQIAADTGLIYSANINSILNGISAVRNSANEKITSDKYLSSLTHEENLASDQANRLNFFITYGSITTKILGAGERAGVISSYKKAFGKLPKTEAEWSDAIKIASGRWPAEESATALAAAKVEFKKVYNREANMSNPNDNAAVSIIAYGLRPSARNTNSEKVAIRTFYYIYGHNPSNSLAWDIVRAIAYSGAKR